MLLRNQRAHNLLIKIRVYFQMVVHMNRYIHTRNLWKNIDQLHTDTGRYYFSIRRLGGEEEEE